jgi:hypothetical protein
MLFRRIIEFFTGEIDFFPVIIYGFIIVGVLLLASAGYDEFRGITHSPADESFGGVDEIITKQGKPEAFRNAMTYHWFYGLMLVMAGVIAFMIGKGQDKCDPLSPDSNENLEEELQRDELDEKRRIAKKQR